MTSALGEFLRARRERLDPADFDLPEGGGRRKAGLRRREVALLAGVSAPYYARLEQGVDRAPSSSVLAALGRVLRLDAEEMAHLYELGNPRPHVHSSDSVDRVDPGLEAFIAGISDRAAVLINRYRDVLAANTLAGALNPAFRVGENLLRHAFLDPNARDIYPDWEEIGAGGVAGLRAMNSDNLADPRLLELVEELCRKSCVFADMWARYEVRNRNDGTKRYCTERAGMVTVRYQSFTVNSSRGQTLFLFSAIPGSSDAGALLNIAEPEKQAGISKLCG